MRYLQHQKKYAINAKRTGGEEVVDMDNTSEETKRRVRLIRPREVAEVLGISRGLVYSLAARGKIKTVRIAGAIRVPEDELERVVSEGTGE